MVVGTTVIVAIASSLAKKVRDLIVDMNRVYFNRGSRENKCNHSISVAVGRICA